MVRRCVQKSTGHEFAAKIINTKKLSNRGKRKHNRSNFIHDGIFTSPVLIRRYYCCANELQFVFKKLFCFISLITSAANCRIIQCFTIIYTIIAKLNSASTLGTTRIELMCKGEMDACRYFEITRV